MAQAHAKEDCPKPGRFRDGNDFVGLLASKCIRFIYLWVFREYAPAAFSSVSHTDFCSTTVGSFECCGGHEHYVDLYRSPCFQDYKLWTTLHNPFRFRPSDGDLWFPPLYARGFVDSFWHISGLGFSVGASRGADSKQSRKVSASSREWYRVPREHIMKKIGSKSDYAFREPKLSESRCVPFPEVPF